MSVYTQFVKEHIHSAPGKTMKEKMRAVAVMWRRHKGKGKGLAPPGSHTGRGAPWSDYGMKPALNGEGFFGDVWEKVVKPIAKKVGPVVVDKAIDLGKVGL